MGAQQDLENKMDELLVKKAPFQIPENGKKAIVRYLPIISLILGILSLLVALRLWNAARKYDDVIDSLNRFGVNTGLYDYNALYYIALIAVVIMGVILIAAYKPLSQKLKKGWDLLLLGTVVSLAFGVIYLFTGPGDIGNFIGSLIGTLIGLYILAQIRSHYKGASAVKTEK